VKLLIG